MKRTVRELLDKIWHYKINREGNVDELLEEAEEVLQTCLDRLEDLEDELERLEEELDD